MRCAAIGVQPEPAERKVEFVPGRRRSEKVAETRVHQPFVHVAPRFALALQVLAGAERTPQLIDRLAAEGHRDRADRRAGPRRDRPSSTRSWARRRARPLNLAGKLTLKELGALTARARLFIGVDSMPMHLAAAMGTPTVALFGPSGEAEWGPWNVAAARGHARTHPLPPLRHRRLRRQQGERVPDAAAGRCGARGGARAARRAA